MIRGLPVSIIAHAVMFGLACIGWPGLVHRAERNPDFPETIQVDLADPDMFTETVPVIVANRPATVPENMPEQPETERPETGQPDLPQDDLIPENGLISDPTTGAAESITDQDIPLPDETVPDLDELSEDPEDIVAEEPEPDRETEPVPASESPDRTADALTDFLDRSDLTLKDAILRGQTDRPPPDTPPPVQTTGRKTTNSRTVDTKRLEILVHNRVSTCWPGVGDLPHPENLNVRILIELDPDGTLTDLRLLHPERRPSGGSAMGVAVDRAVRAIRKCAPYNHLPRDDYAIWKQIRVNLGLAFESG